VGHCPSELGPGCKLGLYMDRIVVAAQRSKAVKIGLSEGPFDAGYLAHLNAHLLLPSKKAAIPCRASSVAIC